MHQHAPSCCTAVMRRKREKTEYKALKITLWRCLVHGCEYFRNNSPVMCLCVFIRWGVHTCMHAYMHEHGLAHGMSMKRTQGRNARHCCAATVMRRRAVVLCSAWGVC